MVLVTPARCQWQGGRDRDRDRDRDEEREGLGFCFFLGLRVGSKGVEPTQKESGGFS